MFKTKHVYTCPDMIYARARAKKYNRVAIATNVLFVAGLWAAGKWLEHKERTNLTNNLEDLLAES